eukprot:m.184745 g.184745  ORF g.184745 m.184745 type:complete len:75 (-) comp15562_c0_seq5:11-235(-)
MNRYPQGYLQHYIVTVTGPANPSVTWEFVGFLHNFIGGEPTPVYEGGPPGDQAMVHHMIGRTGQGIALYNLTWI